MHLYSTNRESDPCQETLDALQEYGDMFHTLLYAVFWAGMKKGTCHSR